MSVENYPDDGWSEEQLLSLIELSAHGGANLFLLLPALEQLSNRRIKKEIEAAKLLLETSRVKGSSNPEAELISESLGRMCNNNDECLMMMIEELKTSALNETFLHEVSLVIPKLGPRQQDRLAPSLHDCVLRLGEDGQSTKLTKCIEAVTSENARKALAEQLNKDLKTGSPLQILLAMLLVRTLSRTENLEAVLSILDKSVRGWYKPYTNQVQSEACKYLVKHPNERAADPLLLILRNAVDLEASSAVAAIATRGVVDKLLNFIESLLVENARNPNGNTWQFASGACHILPNLDPKLIDLRRLLSMEQLISWPDPSDQIKRVVLRVGEPCKPLLLDLLRSPKAPLYSFGRTCLNEMGITLEEMAKVFDRPPIVQLVDFFFGEKSPEKLWAKRKNLGSAVASVNLNSFDFLIQNLLNIFGFITLYVDRGKMQGVDVVGLSPASLKLVIAGVTSAMLKDDLPKLDSTVRELKDTLPALASRFEIVPILFTKVDSDSITPSDSAYASQKGIVVITSANLERLIAMSLTGRTARDFFDFLEERRRETIGAF